MENEFYDKLVTVCDDKIKSLGLGHIPFVYTISYFDSSGFVSMPLDEYQHTGGVAVSLSALNEDLDVDIFLAEVEIDGSITMFNMDEHTVGDYTYKANSADYNLDIDETKDIINSHVKFKLKEFVDE